MSSKNSKLSNFHLYGLAPEMLLIIWLFFIRVRVSKRFRSYCSDSRISWKQYDSSLVKVLYSPFVPSEPIVNMTSFIFSLLAGYFWLC